VLIGDVHDLDGVRQAIVAGCYGDIVAVAREEDCRGQIARVGGGTRITRAHQAAGSVTIDAGAGSSANGTSDIDGDPRTIGTTGTPGK
jgi:hypothetical protein